MADRPLLASTTSGGSFPLSARRRVVLRSSKDRDTRLILMFGYFAPTSLISWDIWAACPPRTSWSQTSSVTAPIFEASVCTAGPGEPDLSAELSLAEGLEPGAHAATAVIPNALAASRSRGERIMVCSFVRGETACQGTGWRAHGHGVNGSWCPLHVRPAGDGGCGTADRSDGKGVNDLFEELVPALQRAAVAGVVPGVADLVPPVGDIPPARSRERATELLNGQCRAQSGEGESAVQRPSGQGADDQTGTEDVAGSGGIECRHAQRGDLGFLTGGRVDRKRALSPVRHHGQRNAVGKGIQGVMRGLGVGIPHRLCGVGHEGVTASELVQDGRRPRSAGVPTHVRENEGAVPARQIPPDRSFRVLSLMQ